MENYTHASFIEIVRLSVDPNFTRPEISGPLADECEVTVVLDALRSLLGAASIPLFFRLFEFFTFHRQVGLLPWYSSACALPLLPHHHPV